MNGRFIGAYLSHNASNRDLNKIKEIFFMQQYNCICDVALYCTHMCVI